MLNDSSKLHYFQPSDREAWHFFCTIIHLISSSSCIIGRGLPQWCECSQKKTALHIIITGEMHMALAHCANDNRDSVFADLSAI